MKLLFRTVSTKKDFFRSRIFFVIVGLMIVTNGFFFIVGKASAAPWTKTNGRDVHPVHVVEMNDPGNCLNTLNI